LSLWFPRHDQIRIMPSMLNQTLEQRRELEGLDRNALAAYQLTKLNRLLDEILPGNRFYAKKFTDTVLPISSLEAVRDWPFTLKEQLITSPAAGDRAANLTYSLDRYVRLHRTSGTQGRPLVVLDTADDWQWWIDSWQFVLDAAGITAQDRALMGFSFGPFIGFWSAYDAVAARGSMVIPTGGLSTIARLELLRTTDATVLFCTPTYAIHLAEVASKNGIDLRQNAVRSVVVAGEPGGSVPAIRQRIEVAFDARVVDHSGASEVGPWGYANDDDTGIHVNESEFLAEFFSVGSGEPAGEDELSELVLTTLGRTGCPVIRYRTGDLVRPCWQHTGRCRFVLLEGGVLGRTDDMMIIRGVNIFPSSIEQIVRTFPEVVEYRITATKSGVMDALMVEVEDRLGDPQRIAVELQLRLGLKVDVRLVESGSLPRFDAKGKRFIDKR